MRYDTQIFFLKDEKVYSPDDSEYIEDSVSTPKRANVTQTSAERQQAEFGDVRSDRYTIRLQRAYKGVYDRIQIGDEYFIPQLVKSEGKTIEVQRWA